MASAPLESKQRSMKEEPRFGLWEDRRFIAIIITVAVAFLCLGVPLVYVYQTYPALRASIIFGKDLFVGFFTVSGILVALDTWRRSGLSSRRLLALRFVEDFGNESSKSGWRMLAKQISQGDSVQIGEIWNSDSVVRQEVMRLLNSCERIAQAVNEGSADERTVSERIGLAMWVFFSTMYPLVLHLRKETNDPGLLMETEHLLSRWRKRSLI
jgi:hypothetical protein